MEGYTINGLPIEILEMFGGDLDPKTISTLKLVNTTFCSVFSNDRFFKSYLCYPEHFYLCEMKSECKAHGVEEVVKAINNGRVGRWKGYLQLEKTHTDNWRRARFDTFDTLPFPKDFNIFSSWRHMEMDDCIDNENEHWLLCTTGFDYCAIFCLFNITAKPKLVATVTTSDGNFNKCALKKLLPGQVILPIDSKGQYNVYRIVHIDNNYVLEHQYSFNDMIEKCAPQRGLLREIPDHGCHIADVAIITSNRDELHGHSRNIFVSAATDLLHIWDLNTGLKIGTVTLRQHGIWQEFLLAHDDALVLINTGEFPFVIVTLQDHLTVQVTLFDVLKSEVTYLLDMELNEDNLYKELSMHWNYVYVEVENSISVYMIEPNEDCKSSKHGRLLLRINDTGVMARMFFNKYKTILCYDVNNDSTDQLVVKVLNLNGAEVNEQTFILADYTSNDVVEFVHPNLLVMFKDGSFIVKVIDTAGNELCSREDLEPVNPLGFKHEWSFTSMSKYVLVPDDECSIRLYHF